MYIFAFVLFVLSFLSLFAPPFSVLFFGAGALVMGWKLAARFWRQTRIRLIELMVMTVVSGGVLGFSIRALLGGSQRFDEEQILQIAVVLFVVLFWMLGGVSNAVIVAERLKIDSTLGRLKLMGIYLLLPVVIIGAPALGAVLANVKWLGGYSLVSSLLLLSLVAGVFVGYAWRLKAKAERAAIISAQSLSQTPHVPDFSDQAPAPPSLYHGRR